MGSQFIIIHLFRSIQIYDLISDVQVTDRLQTGYITVTSLFPVCFLLLPGHVVLRTLPAECWCQCGPQSCAFSLGPS